MTIFRNHSGSITITELVRDNWGNRFYTDMTYYDYSLREARQRFVQHIAEKGWHVL